MTICASNLGCGTLYVSVQPASSIQNTSSSNISFSQSSVTLGVGQSQAVTLSGPGNYYVSANSNIGIVSTSINGSSLILGGVSAGTVAVSVCSSGNNTTSCGTVNVTVTSTNTVSNSSNVPAMLNLRPVKPT